MARPSLTILKVTATVSVALAAGLAVDHARRTMPPPPAALAKVAVAAPLPSLPVDPGPTPAVPRPARPLSVLSLDGRDTPFPAATFTVTRSTGGLHAVLCTDDPSAAMEPGYAGNSFMFDMRVPADQPEDLRVTPWDYREDEASDATGIYLHGDRDQLQPTAGVRVAFRKDAQGLLAIISGPFLHLDRHDPSAPPERVQVYGCVRCLPAEK